MSERFPPKDPTVRMEWYVGKTSRHLSRAEATLWDATEAAMEAEDHVAAVKLGMLWRAAKALRKELES